MALPRVPGFHENCNSIFSSLFYCGSLLIFSRSSAFHDFQWKNIQLSHQTQREIIFISCLWLFKCSQNKPSVLYITCPEAEEEEYLTNKNNVLSTCRKHKWHRRVGKGRICGEMRPCCFLLLYLPLHKPVMSQKDAIYITNADVFANVNK